MVKNFTVAHHAFNFNGVFIDTQRHRAEIRPAVPAAGPIIHQVNIGEFASLYCGGFQME